MHDSVRIAIWLGAITAFVAGFCLCYLVLQNLGSRNIALATGALFGAFILLLIQLLFELRSEETTDFISAEFTIDRAKPEIRQWNYSETPRLRITQEIAASKMFFDAHPHQFDGDRQKLTLDMVIFSLVSYLGVEQFDWQIKRTSFVSQSIGTVVLMAPGSNPGDCTEITKSEIRDKLLGAGNSFAEGEVFFGRQLLCLPPNSTLRVDANSLSLRNPLCEISFVLEPSGGSFGAQPSSGGLVQALLQNGEPTLETRVTGIRVTVRYSALRAQHHEMAKYKDWSKRVVGGAQNWFMGK